MYKVSIVLLLFFLSAMSVPEGQLQSCMTKTFSNGKALATTEAEDMGQMCQPEDTSAQLVPANPFKVNMKVSLYVGTLL